MTIHGGAIHTITGGTGDDTIAGGEGDDVAVFHGVQDDFTFAVAPNGTLTVTDLNTNTAFGVDTISEVETLWFTEWRSDGYDHPKWGCDPYRFDGG